ncbi:hypothetical protein GUJ93_ZPchr0009g916 [Zizania palustris]|uniref:Uncharacterized protein n=1 Tax=Zizania palustris TaxID=103762 RepID=A0A8J5S1K4_ZIZPA|nr:hypothetical protein GUJ93_ZPchr0009g916 [Zizania palustris]
MDSYRNAAAVAPSPPIASLISRNLHRGSALCSRGGGGRTSGFSGSDVSSPGGGVYKHDASRVPEPTMHAPARIPSAGEERNSITILELA